jgi:hypothetical protein
MNVKRFIGDKPSRYRIVGLLILKPEIDTFSGLPMLSMACRLGDYANPVNFRDFFQLAQLAATE